MKHGDRFSVELSSLLFDWTKVYFNKGVDRMKIARVLALLVVAVVLISASGKLGAIYDVKTVAATYPALPPFGSCSPTVAPRPLVRIAVSAIDAATGGPPTGAINWNIHFQDAVATIPDSQLPNEYDRNCLCEVPAPSTVTAPGTLLLAQLNLRYTGNGTCNGRTGFDVNQCVMPAGDYRFDAQALNVSSNTGGMSVGVLQVRGTSICDPGGAVPIF